MWKIEKTVSKGDYVYAKVAGHPHATKNGYVLLHRMVMENHLGRLLSSEEVVHHINGNRYDNKLENLEVMGRIEHVEHHMSQKIKTMCLLKCPMCGTVFLLPRNETFLSKKTSNATCCSRSCGCKLGRQKQLNRITPEMERAISENILLVFETTPSKLKTEGCVETIRPQPEMVKK